MAQNVKTCLNAFTWDLQVIIIILSVSHINQKYYEFLPFYTHDYSLLSGSQAIKWDPLETFNVMKRILTDKFHLFQDSFGVTPFHFLQEPGSCFCPFDLIIRQFLASSSLHRLYIPCPL